MLVIQSKKTTDYDTESSEIQNKIATDHDHHKYITIQEFKKLISENFNVKLKQAKMILLIS